MTLNAACSAVIPAGPSQVYAIIADYREGHPKMLPPVFFRDLVVTAGGHGAGTAFTAKAILFGRAHPFAMTVSEPEPGRVLTETDAGTGMSTSFTVEAHGENASKVTISTSWEPQKGISGLLERWLVPPQLRKIYREELRLLAALFAT